MSRLLKKIFTKVSKEDEIVSRIIRNGNDCYYRIELKNRQLDFISTSVQNILGYSQEEFMNNPDLLMDILEPESKNDFLNRMDELNRGNDQQEIEYKLKAKNGEIRWIRIRSNLLMGNNQQAIAVEGSITDITEQIYLENKLKLSEKSYETISKTISNLLLTINNNGVIIECNQQISEITGQQPKNVVGKAFSSIFHQEYLQPHQGITATVLEGNRIKQHDCILKHKNGHKVYAILDSVGICTGEGEVERVVCSFNDITNRKKAEQEIRFVSDVNSILSKISREALKPNFSIRNLAKMVHFAAMELTSSEFGFIAFHEPMQKDVKQVIITLNGSINETHNTNLEKNEKFLVDTISNVEYKYLNKADIESGVKNICEVNEIIVIPSKFKDHVIGHLCVGTKSATFESKHINVIRQLNDVYTFALLRKRFELDLIRNKEKAVESEKLKSTFLSIISHELRTPMNGILGFSGILDKEDMPVELKTDYLGMLELSTKRLLTVLDDIILYSKLETNNIFAQNAEVKLDYIIQKVFEYTENLLEQNNKPNILLTVATDESIKDTYIYTDKEKLQQILKHLLSNAVKFTANGSISFGYTLEDNLLKFFVHDTGVGIAEEKLPIVFDRFRQEDDTHTRKYGGTGLGLSITQKLVQLIGGQLKVKSEKSVGSEFYFEIDYQPVESKEEKKEEGVLLKIEDWSGKSVLIVEDEDVNIILIESLLHTTGATHQVARTGSEAIEAVKKADFDIVLMDIKLPEMDGYEATEKIKKLKPYIPVVAQTAYAYPEEQEKAVQAGCDDFISKPLNKRKFYQIIQKQFSKS